MPIIPPCDVSKSVPQILITMLMIAPLHAFLTAQKELSLELMRTTLQGFASTFVIFLSFIMPIIPLVTVFSFALADTSPATILSLVSMSALALSKPPTCMTTMVMKVIELAKIFVPRTGLPKILPDYVCLTAPWTSTPILTKEDALKNVTDSCGNMLIIQRIDVWELAPKCPICLPIMKHTLVF